MEWDREERLGLAIDDLEFMPDDDDWSIWF